MSNTEFMAYGAIMAVGLGLSAVFSGMEIGLYTINRVRVTVRAGRGERAALRLQRSLGRAPRTLSTLLLGNNLANYAGSFGLAAILDGMAFGPGQSIAINAGVLIPLLFVFGETLPKDLFRTHTDRWSYGLSGFLTACERVFTFTGLAPLVEAFGSLAGRMLGGESNVPSSARQRISRLIKEGVGSGVLSVAQIDLVDRALTMRQRTVHGEMVPWSRVTSLRADADSRRRHEVIHETNHTRLPVVDADGSVAGILPVIDALLNPEASVVELARTGLSFAPGTPVLEALRTMRQTRQAMAIVIERSTSRPLGLVTLKDLVEPLTGELAAW